MEAARFAFDPAAFRVVTRVTDPRVARHDAAKPRHRQTTLPPFFHVVRERNQHRIDDLGIRNRLRIGIARIVLDTEYHDAQRNANLRRRETRALVLSHRIAHVGEQRVDRRRVEPRNFLRAFEQTRIAHAQHFSNHL